MATTTSRPRRRGAPSTNGRKAGAKRLRARAERPSGSTARARPAVPSAAGRAGSDKADKAAKGVKELGSAAQEAKGPSTLKLIALAWRVARLGMRVAKGKRPKAKQLRKTASTATDVGFDALLVQARKLPLQELGEMLRRVPAGQVTEVLRRIPTEQLPEHVRQLPVQRSIDVAVPLEVAYSEWMKLDSLPEGAHRVENIKRREDHLVGRLNGLREPRRWEAEIRDERPNESFAWRSTRGSDVAGLITFHRLAERLTRLELGLDVVPTRVTEAASLALHLADRRAESELRRFKLRVETIDPAQYERPKKAAKRKSPQSTKQKEG